ncbi:MAG: crossover junction endodeoxyribonuclease RuvC [Opitutales bacterium]|nr:crossover junction endodeoxyribonuclease RuvC [Opitutales bacterium]
MARSSRSLWTQKILSGSVEKNDGLSLQVSRSRGSAMASLPPIIPGARLPYSGFVLGIDPSLRGSGFAVVEFAPGAEPKLHFSKTLKIARDVSLATCLGEIYKLCADCCEDFPVRHVALEETIYVNNFKVAQVLGAARGAAIAAASVLGRKVFEYPPLRIKQAVVGFGRAQKSQVAGMTKQILKLAKELPFDESDAAAAALCHGYTYRD